MPRSQPPRAARTLPGAALVTGASSGIGLELARLLARDGHPLYLVARGREALEHAAAELTRDFGVAAHTIVADLAHEGAVERLFECIAADGARLEVVINNAGYGLAGPVATADLDRTLGMIRLNVEALTAITQRALPDMLARGRGRIMNVASTAAFQPGPLMAVYYATKAYVLSFTEAVAEEVRGSGVTLTALCPGPTKTKFAEIAGMRQSRAFSSAFTGDAAWVARVGYRGMLRGRRVVVPGTLNRLVALGTRFVPRRVTTTLSRLAQENR